MTTMLSRRALLSSGSMLAGAAALNGGWLVAAARAQAAPTRAAVRNAGNLADQSMYPLPLGAITAAGWLERQLRIQADGLCGHLDNVWRECSPTTSLWITGRVEPNVSAERVPYWLDGLVPLAWMVAPGDTDAITAADLQAKVRRFLRYSLVKGNLAKIHAALEAAGSEGWWPCMAMLKVMTQYHEYTGDASVLVAMTAFFDYQANTITAKPFESWACYRWQDNLYAIIWLHNRVSDAAVRDMLLQLADTISNGVGRHDWKASFRDPDAYRFKTRLRKADPDDRLPMPAHGVNIGMAFKAGPLTALLPNVATTDAGLALTQLQTLDRYHGLPNGMYSCCEHLAGRDPNAGSETCSIVETMFSLEVALAITGQAALADRIERLAFNALPAALDASMRARLYDQQPNQVNATGGGPWVSDGADANVYSLAGFLGCCTTNFGQGWPKFVNSLWMATDTGLAVAMYGPSGVDTLVGGTRVRITQETKYPFGNDVTIQVDEASTRFPLKLRIPAWAGTATTISVNGQSTAVKRGWTVIDREWRTGDVVAIRFASTPKAVSGHAGSISFEDGPLLYALPVDATVVTPPYREHAWVDPTTAPDWKVTDYLLSMKSGADWRFAVDGTAPTRGDETKEGYTPFSRNFPRRTLKVDGYAIEAAAWKLMPFDNPNRNDTPDPSKTFADNIPSLSAGQLTGAVEPLVLIPYGAAKLRVTSFPRRPT